MTETDYTRCDPVLGDFEDMSLRHIEEEIFEAKQSLITWALETAPEHFEDCVYLRQKLEVLWKIEERINNADCSEYFQPSGDNPQ